VRLQKSHAVDKRFAEVANQRKQIEAALSQLKNDPAKALKEIAGLDLDEWAEKRILERYQEAMMPEAEREKAEMQRKLADYERQFEEQKTSAESAKQQAYEQQVFEKTEQEFIQAVETLGYDKGFSRTVLVPMMAEIAESALDYGVELTPSQMASEANKRLETIHRRQVQGLKGEQLLKYLGDDVVTEAIRAKLAATRGSAAAPSTPPPAARKPVTDAPRKPMTPAEWRNKHLYGME
jgi:flagellar hook-length control protein FliK